MTSPARVDLESEKRRYLLGIAKDGASSGSAALGDFALVAMRSRFERPQPPALDTAEPLPADPRPLISDAARQNLLRICTGKAIACDRPARLGSGSCLAARGRAAASVRFLAARGFCRSLRAASWVRAQKRWARMVRPGRKEAEADATAAIASEEDFVAAGHAARLAYLRMLARKRAGSRPRARRARLCRAACGRARRPPRRAAERARAGGFVFHRSGARGSRAIGARQGGGADRTHSRHRCL